MSGTMNTKKAIHVLEEYFFEWLAACDNFWCNLSHPLDWAPFVKYKEGKNRPSSANQTALVLNHDKSGNKCYTLDNTNTRNPSMWIGAREE